MNNQMMVWLSYVELYLLSLLSLSWCWRVWWRWLTVLTNIIRNRISIIDDLITSNNSLSSHMISGLNLWVEHGQFLCDAGGGGYCLIIIYLHVLQLMICSISWLWFIIRRWRRRSWMIFRWRRWSWWWWSRNWRIAVRCGSILTVDETVRIPLPRNKR